MKKQVTKLVKLFSVWLILVNFLVLCNGTNILALTQAQKDAIKSGARYFNTEEDVAVLCGENVVNAQSSSRDGSVYFVGDSLTIGMRDSGQLTQKVTATGRQVLKIQAAVGDSVDDALPKVASNEDRTAIASSNTVVVALGTNDGASTNATVFTPRINEMISAIKSANNSVSIFWMNAYKDGDDSAYAGINTAINNRAGPLGYNVIDWNSEANNNTSRYGPFDASLGVHPSNYSELANFVVSRISGTATGAATIDGCVCSVATSSTLVGSTNAEQAWNYFKSRGLSDAQTAAILGNLKRESGINPRRVQNTPTPEGDSDINPLDGRTGYGIAQWTDIGRQQGLSNYANETNRPVSSLDLQLDYIYKEMTSGPVWDNLRSISGNDERAIETATIYVEGSYENSDDSVGSSGMNERIRGAIAYYNLYSGAPGLSDPSPGTPICNPGTGPGEACVSGDIIGWSLSGNCAMVNYDQTDSRWANVPYGAGKTPIGESGCGPTSLAMVGATLLKDTNITPETVATRYGDQYHGDGTLWSLFPVYARDTGLNFRDLGTDLNAAAEIIRSGGLVVISVDPGHFTGNGHLMVIRAITPDGNGFYLADPNGDGINNDSETRAFSADFLRTTGSMKHLWGYTK